MGCRLFHQNSCQKNLNCSIKAIFLIVPLLVNLLVAISKDIYIYFSIISYGTLKIDEKGYYKADFTNTVTTLKEIPGIKIEIGDIIVLKKKDYCPADIVLLDCKDDWCFLDTIEIDGVSQYTIKKPLAPINANKKDMKSFINTYKEYFTGKIEYTKPQRSEKEFQGYLKLQNDPKGQNIEFSNLILRGSQIKYSDWVIGLVITKGKEITNVSQLQNSSSDRKFKNFLNRFMQMSIVWIVFGILTTSVWKTLHEQGQIFNNIQPSWIIQLIYAIQVYSTQAPIIVYSMIDICTLLQKFVVERKYGKQQTQIVINNPDAVSNLCHIDYAVFSQTGTITQKDQEEIVGVIYDGKFFQVNDSMTGTEEDEIENQQYKQKQQQNNIYTEQGYEKQNTNQKNNNSPNNVNTTQLFEMSNLKTIQQDGLLQTQYNAVKMNSMEKLNTIPNNDNTFINDASYFQMNKTINENNISQFDSKAGNHNNESSNVNISYPLNPNNNFFSFKKHPKNLEHISFLDNQDKNDKNEGDEYNLSQNQISSQTNSKQDLDLMQRLYTKTGTHTYLNILDNADQIIKEEEDMETVRDPSSKAYSIKNSQNICIEGHDNPINIQSQCIQTPHLKITENPSFLQEPSLPNFLNSQKDEQINTVIDKDNQPKQEMMITKLQTFMDDLGKTQSISNSQSRDARTNSIMTVYIQFIQKQLSQQYYLLIQIKVTNRSIPLEKANQKEIPTFSSYINKSKLTTSSNINNNCDIQDIQILQKDNSKPDSNQKKSGRFFQEVEKVFNQQNLSQQDSQNKESDTGSIKEDLDLQQIQANLLVTHEKKHSNHSRNSRSSSQNINSGRQQNTSKYKVIRPQAINIEQIYIQNNRDTNLLKELHPVQDIDQGEMKTPKLPFDQLQAQQFTNTDNEKDINNTTFQHANSIQNTNENQKNTNMNNTDTYTQFDARRKNYVQREIYKFSEYQYTPTPLIENMHSQLSLKDIKVELKAQDHQQQYFNDYNLENPTTEFVKSIVLCHQIKTKKPKESQDGIYIHDLSSHEENILLRLAKSLKVSFVYSGAFNSKKFYQINFINKELRYEIKGVNTYSQERGRFSIILKEQALIDHTQGGIGSNHTPSSPDRKKNSSNEDKKQFMLVRGDEKSILHKCLMSKTEKDKLNKLLNNFSMNGMHFIIYAKKYVTNSQISDFKKQIQMAHQEANDQTETIIDNFESDLTLLGIVCLRQKMVPQIHQTIDIIRNSDICTWVLSGDKQQKAIAAALQAEIIAPHSEFLVIDQTNYDELKYQIKSHLLQVQKLILKEDEDTNSPSPSYRSKANQVRTRRLSSMVGHKGKGDSQDQINRLVLQVNGNSLLQILKDPYLKSHFSFLCMICKSVIGYDFSHEEKAHMTQLIHESFVVKPTVLAIGASWCDSWMMNVADVSLQIDSPGDRANINQKRMLGDILIDKLKDFKKCILDESIHLQEKIRSLVILIFKYSFFYTLLNYINALHSYQYYTLAVQYNQILMNHFLQIIISSFFLFSGRFSTTRSCVINVYPSFYRFCKNYFSWIKSHFLETIIMGAVEGLIVSILLEDTFFGYNSSDGRLRDDKTVSDLLCIIYTLSLVIMTQCLNGIFSLKARILHLFFSVIQITLTLVWNQHQNLNTDLYVVNLTETLNQSCVWIMFFSVSVFIWMFEMLYQKILRKYITNNIIRKFIKEQSENMNFQGMLGLKPHQNYIKSLKAHPTMNPQFYANLFKALFTHVEMDGFLRKIIDPGEKVENLSGIDKLKLKFNDERLEKSYRSHKLQFVWTIYLKPITLMSFILLLSTLFYLIYNQSKNTYLLILDILRLIVEFCSTVAYAAIWFHKKFSVFQLSNIIKINIRVMLSTILVLYSISIVFYDDSQMNQILQEHLVLFAILSWDAIPPPFIFPIVLNFLNYISLFIFVIAIQNQGSEQNLQIYYKATITVVLFFYSLLNIGSYYNKDYLRRDLFLMENRIKFEENKVDHVLANLLPNFVRSRFNRNGDTNIEEDQGEVAIIFVEIVSFDEILKEQDENFIHWLDNLYRSFDYVCQRYGVQKIETVGKVYMACSGLDVAKHQKAKKGNDRIWRENETKKALDAAFAIQKKAQKIYWGSKSQKTTLKIGIHYGRVIAGVIGYHKPQFSLIGDTVNTTSRVCSHCEANNITLSKQAHERVKDQDYISKGEIVKNVKGKGDLQVYKYFKREKLLRRNSDKDLSLDNTPYLKKKYNEGEKRSPQLIKSFSMQGNALLTQNNIKNLFQFPQNGNVNGSPHNQNNLANTNNQNQSNNNSNNNSNIIPSISSINQSSRQNSQCGNNQTTAAALTTTNNNSSLYPQHTIQHYNRAATKKPSQYIRKSSFENLDQQSTPSSKSKTFNQINMIDLSPKRKSKRMSNTVVIPRVSIISKFDDLDIDEEDIEPEKHFNIANSESQYISQQDEEKDEKGTSSNLQQKNQSKSPQINKQEQETNNAAYLQIKNTWLLTLENEKEETVMKFKKMIRKDLQKSYQISSFILIAVHFFKTLMLFVIGDVLQSRRMTVLITIRMIFEIVLFILMILYSKALNSNFLNYINLIFFFISVIFLQILSGQVFNQESFNTLLIIDYFEGALAQNVISNFSTFSFQQSLIFNIIYSAIWIYNIKTSFIQIALVVCLSVFEIMRNFFRQRLYIQNYNQIVKLDNKKTEKDSLLRHLLPQHVLTKFFQDQQKKQEFQETLQDVTLLFADISGFTSYSSKSRPEDVVKMLRELFIEFDKSCITRNVYKVYTIGDCYVVLGMTNINNRIIHEEAKNVVDMGFSMIKTIQFVRDKVNNSDLQMRIGIHTGKILGGILGTNIVRYDIFGKDVMIANKVESNGLGGKISVSESTKVLLENNYKDIFKFQNHNPIKLKNFEEEIKTYIVEQN
ncbi:hypothetical protein ABPG74_017007 [Tetrahymena malaccensis]